MRTITGTITAFLTDTHKDLTPAMLIAAKPETALSSISFYHRDIPGWTKIGTAEITVTFDDDDEIIGNMVESLKAEKQKLQADTQVAINKIDERIQSLLALPAPV